MSSRDGGIRILPGGASVLGGGSGAFVRRFVSLAGVPVLTADTRTQVDASGATEQVLYNPGGAVQGRIAADTVSSLLANLDGGRFGEQATVQRGGGPPNARLLRYNGSRLAPTGVLNGQDAGYVDGVAFGSDNAQHVVSRLAFFTREAVTGPANRGGGVRILACTIGAAGLNNVLNFRTGGAGIAEVAYDQVTGRIVPAAGGLLAIRDPANTTNRIEVNATGIGFFNVAPVARPNIVGARGGNAALADLLTKGALLGLWTDGTTP